MVCLRNEFFFEFVLNRFHKYFFLFGTFRRHQKIMESIFLCFEAMFRKRIFEFLIIRILFFSCLGMLTAVGSNTDYSAGEMLLSGGTFMTLLAGGAYLHEVRYVNYEDFIEQQSQTQAQSQSQSQSQSSQSPEKMGKYTLFFWIVIRGLFGAGASACYFIGVNAIPLGDSTVSNNNSNVSSNIFG